MTGRGVGVALIDTGVAPVKGLTSGNVVNGPDLSFESQSDDYRYLDTFGHGTHMAGIIAGNDPATLLGDRFQGIAPGAQLTSLKVGADRRRRRRLAGHRRHRLGRRAPQRRPGATRSGS